MPFSVGGDDVEIKEYFIPKTFYTSFNKGGGHAM